MFVNRGAGDHRLLIADFSDGAYPASSCQEVQPGDHHPDRLLRQRGRGLAGDFRETGRDQIAFVNRTAAGSDRVKVLDFSSSVIVPNSSDHSPGLRLLARIQSNDDVLSGDLTGDGHAQLITLERLSSSRGRSTSRIGSG